ncbi:MAG: class I SAM-dependent methyltransferase [Chloroflexota bacterium]
MNDPRSAEWFATNRASWDERVPIHVASRFYDVPGFLAGRDTLQSYERDEVGDVTGKTLVHLQCHFGMDALTWARRGARVTGLDFSGAAIAQARELARGANIDAEFVEANVYDAVEILAPRQFDVVYVGVGSLVWLPDVARWAEVAANLVRSGGFLYLNDVHPLSEVLADDALVVANDYFSHEPIVADEPGTYAELGAVTTYNLTYAWTHSIGEVVSALAAQGLRIEFLRERDYVIWPRFPFLEAQLDGTYRMPAGMPSMPMMYSLRASKPA